MRRALGSDWLGGMVVVVGKEGEVDNVGVRDKEVGGGKLVGRGNVIREDGGLVTRVKGLADPKVTLMCWLPISWGLAP